ncbi:MAG: hypothetical protein ACYC6Y_00785 [Thermoguttaceae bacterium]
MPVIAPISSSSAAPAAPRDSPPEFIRLCIRSRRLPVPRLAELPPPEAVPPLRAVPPLLREEPPPVRVCPSAAGPITSQIAQNITQRIRNPVIGLLPKVANTIPPLTPEGRPR